MAQTMGERILMKAPFIFNDSNIPNESGDLVIIEDLVSVYRDVEIQDIEHPDVVIYDSEGWVLKPKNIDYPFYELYRAEKKAGQLKSVLLDYLVNRKKISLPDLELKQVHDLIELASKYADT